MPAGGEPLAVCGHAAMYHLTYPKGVQHETREVVIKRYASRYAAGTESYRELTECFPDETDRGTEYVLASDYDALAAEVSRRDQQLKESVDHEGEYMRRIAALEAELAEAKKWSMWLDSERHAQEHLREVESIAKDERIARLEAAWAVWREGK